MSDEKSNDLDAFLDESSKDAMSEEGSSLLDDLPNDEESQGLTNDLVEEKTDDFSLSDDDQNQSTTNEADMSSMIEEANESLITANSDPFSTEDFERLNSSLVNIESKIDGDKTRLEKLDLLDGIKEDIAKINENLSGANLSSRQGHNLPNIDQLLSRIDELENKINNQEATGSPLPQDNEMNDKLEEITKSVQKLNLSSGTIQKRFERVEETLGRFEEMEKDIQVEYIDEKENEDTPEEHNKKVLLYGLLVILILMVCGAVVLDRLNIVDFYLDELFRTFFN